MKYNFDNLPNRRNTNSYKWDVKENELPMWVADMDFETAPMVKKAIQKRVDIGAYGYSSIPDEFFMAFQYWWKKRHHVKYELDWMIYSSGIVAAISSMVRKLTSVGENVLIQSPTYNIFYNSIVNNGRNVVSNDLVYKDGEYHIDFDDLEEKMKNPQTTLMILCNPHNPMGKIWTKEELAKIGELAKKYNVVVISDEIHCDIVEPGSEYVPFASVNKTNQQLSVTCVAISKTFNCAGLQSACIIVPNDLLRHKVWRGLNTDEVAEPNFFSMDANIAALTKGEEWVNQLNDYINENKKYVKDFIEKEIPNLHVVPSKATYLVWIDISKYSNDSIALTEDLRQKTGLFLSEGREYGLNGACFMRMNLATSKANVIDGCNRLKKYFTSL